MKIERAFDLARIKHDEFGQTYGDGVPYFLHLRHVYQVLERFGYNGYSGDKDHISLSQDLLVAAYLHDIVEDTDITLNEVKRSFGKRIASLVNGVTNEPGNNRRARHQKTHPKTKRIPGAIILKLADRIANAEACLASGDGRINMYRKEWAKFQESLRVPGEHDRMWRYLDRLLE